MHDFVGRWKITSMSNWSVEFVNMIRPGYFLFTEDGLGEFAFCAMQGWMDVRVSHRMPYLEFSWQGRSEGDDIHGRGVIEFPTPDIGEGLIFIHCGEESRFTIEREI